MALAGAAAVAALPAMFIFRDDVVVRLSGHDAPPEAIWAIVAVALLIGAMVVLGFYFFRHLYRIVGTVGEGDPFVPVNAERLRAMGWITVAVHVLGIPMAAITRWVEVATDNVRIEADVPLAGLLLAVVLFVLARVFREGTRMRDEMEGTV
jgi:uncharacterized membrane protein YidH (DUF202 family)